MDPKQKMLFHQIHPAKLATDIVAAAISLYFFWHQQLALGLLTHIVPPIAASWLIIRYVDLEPYRLSAAGRYVARYMTRIFDYLRLFGDVVMVLGAWYQRPNLIIVGLVIIVGAWANGFFRPRHLLKR